MLHQIIYTSSAAPSATLEDFSSICRHANENNKTLDVTGILLFTDGVILQVLEGKKEIVETLYGHIKRDPRHTNVMKMISRSTTHREFPDWSMGFAKEITEHAYELSFLLTKETLASAMPANPTPELRILSDTYARVNGL